MTVHVGVSGVHKDVEELHVGVSGVWKQITEGWVGVSGVWKLFYELIEVALPTTDFVAAFTVGVNATAVYRLESDGDMRGTQGTNTIVGIGEWLSGGGSSADYEVRVTLVSGDTPTGTLGSWLALSTTRSWTLVSTGPGVLEAVFTVEIRDVATSTVLTTSTVTMQAERS